MGLSSNYAPKIGYRPPFWSVLSHGSGIIRHVQTYSGIFRNYSDIFRHNALSLSRHKQVCLSSLNALVHDVINLVYYEHWTDKLKYFYIYSDISTILCNPDIFRTLTYSVPRAYLEPCQTNMMEVFAKLVNNYNYFPKF